MSSGVGRDGDPDAGGSSQSMAGVLCPTPRGSNATMSKYWLSGAKSPAPAACR